MTALLQNVMFPVEKNYEMDLAAAETCAKDVVAFAKSVANAVIVSDYIYSDAQRYDEGTECYRKSLAKIDRLLAQISDTVIEVSAGQLIFHKGGLPGSRKRNAIRTGSRKRNAIRTESTLEDHSSISRM